MSSRRSGRRAPSSSPGGRHGAGRAPSPRSRERRSSPTAANCQRLAGIAFPAEDPPVPGGGRQRDPRFPRRRRISRLVAVIRSSTWSTAGRGRPLPTRTRIAGTPSSSPPPVASWPWSAARLDRLQPDLHRPDPNDWAAVATTISFACDHLPTCDFIDRSGWRRQEHSGGYSELVRRTPIASGPLSPPAGIFNRDVLRHQRPLVPALGFEARSRTRPRWSPDRDQIQDADAVIHRSRSAPVLGDPMFTALKTRGVEPNSPSGRGH
jgi:hypothetical protein